MQQETETAPFFLSFLIYILLLGSILCLCYTCIMLYQYTEEQNSLYVKEEYYVPVSIISITHYHSDYHYETTLKVKNYRFNKTEIFTYYGEKAKAYQQYKVGQTITMLAHITKNKQSGDVYKVRLVDTYA